MVTVYSPEEFDVLGMLESKQLVHRQRGKRKKTGERDVIDLVTAFDIECSTLHLPLDEEHPKHNAHSFMYVWQWAFSRFEVVVGRTWEQFTAFCEKIRAALDEYKTRARLDKRPLLVSYVHNLAYEWQFLAGIYRFKADETFFAKERKPIYCRMFDSLEMRCSYKQTNMSLDKFAEKMGCSVRKLSGQKYDYTKMRYPWTPLSPFEMDYVTADVVALVEAMETQLDRDGDTLLTIPLTSTGYVRRDCKRALSAQRNYIIKPQLPSVDAHRMLRAAFRGGNTHANPAFVGKVLDDVESVDMASCYPAQQLTKKFPMQKFQFLRNADMQRVLRFIALGYAVVATWRFTNLEVKNPNEPCPYISLAKTHSVNFRLDNGRILYAAVSEMTLTEVDLEIILDTYKYDSISVTEAMVAQKDYLPKEYREVIMNYYRYKTGMKAAAATDSDIEYQYMKSKNKLNSVYGMSAQDPIHQRVTFNGVEFTCSDYNDDEAVKDLEKAPFPYQWGVYTTAYARQALQEGIKRAGDKLVYVDTDSVKTYGHVDFTDINVSRETVARKMGASAADEKGVQHAVGVFEVDGIYKQFITQGAKRYAYIYGTGKKVGKMGVTVSGVTQKINEATGIAFCVEELQTLENFKPGMEWVKAGGTTALYNDDDDFEWKTADGIVRITRNVAIIETTYHMTHAKDYARLLQELELYGVWKKQHE